MPRYLTIGYGSSEGYEGTPQEVRDEAHRHDSELVDGGADVGILGEPSRVSNHQHSGMVTERGPFMSSPLPVAGFAIIEASSMAEAMRMVAETPCAVADGAVEVWPIEEPQ